MFLLLFLKLLGFKDENIMKNFIILSTIFTCMECLQHGSIFKEADISDEYAGGNVSASEGEVDGVHLKTIPSTPSKFTCSLRCQRHEECTTISYNNQGETCSLYKQIPTLFKSESTKVYQEETTFDCQPEGNPYDKKHACCNREKGGYLCDTAKEGLSQFSPSSSCEQIFLTFPRFQEGVYWIQDVNMSVPEQRSCKIQADIPCTTSTEGEMYQHPKNCKFYHKCRDGELEIAKCFKTDNGESQIFDDMEQKCSTHGTCFEYQSDTCYGSKGDQFGTFKSSKAGIITKLKLVHKSGYVSNVPNGMGSRWGTTKGEFATAITNNRNVVYFGNKTIYSLNSFTTNSDYIILNAVGSFQVSKDEMLKVWFAEDLQNFTESGNHGTHCIKVYAAF